MTKKQGQKTDGAASKDAIKEPQLSVLRRGKVSKEKY